MPTFQIPGDQMVTIGGFPTGLARPSMALSHFMLSGTPLIGGRIVSYEELYRKQPLIGACVQKIQRQVSRLPLKAYKRTGDDTRERLRNGYLVDLIERPWERAGPTHLKQALLLSPLVHGNGVLAKVRSAGAVRAWKPLPWRLVTPMLDVCGEPIAWRTDPTLAMKRFLDPEEVVHVGFRGLNGALGVSPLEQLGVTISIEDAAQRYQQAQFKNGGRPPSAVTMDKSILEFLSPEEQQAAVEQAREDIVSIHSLPEQAGKPAVLPPGFAWQMVGHTSVEAELIDQRKLTREEIAAVYDIPPPLIGILEYATLANVEESHRMLFTTILAPWLTLIEETITAQIIGPEASLRGDVWVEFDLSDVLRGDLLKRAQALALQISNGVLTIDEARLIENRPAFDLPVTSRPLYPSNNLTPVPDDLPETPPEPSEADVGEAAEAVAAMGEHELRALLRKSPSVTDAIRDVARGNAVRRDEYAFAMNGRHEEGQG